MTTFPFRPLALLAWEALKLAGCLLLFLGVSAVALVAGLLPTPARHAVQIEDDAPPDDRALGPDAGEGRIRP